MNTEEANSTDRLSDMESGPLYKKGDLVRLHPKTDWFMRGAKYGEIVSIMQHRSGRFSYVVDLIVSGSNIGKRARLHELSILGTANE